MNFKKRLFSYKHKKVIANNGTNKGATETKLVSHVGATLFIYLCCFPDFLKKGISPLALKGDQFNICCTPPHTHTHLFFLSLYLSFPFPCSSNSLVIPLYAICLSHSLSLAPPPSLSLSLSLYLFLFLPPIYPMFLFSDFTIIFFFFTFCFLSVCM